MMITRDEKMMFLFQNLREDSCGREFEVGREC